MARLLKDKWLGARTDNETYETVQAYIKATDISLGDLIRESVVEYMIKHPVEDAHKQRNEKLRAIRESLNLDNI